MAQRSAVTKSFSRGEIALPRTSLCMSLLEINTRVWIKRFGPNTTLEGVPPQTWENISKTGMDMVWAMGVWRGSPETVSRCCFEPQLLESYQRALSDYSPKDVIGSPYAIDRYLINPSLGGNRSIEHLRQQLHRQGLQLILDFVPNHFSEGSRLIAEAPYVFLPGTEELLRRDGKTFYRPVHAPNLILAHGKDPYFDAWSDTAQINYFSEAAAQFMTEQLLHIAGQCDGVRCDMAMLALNDVFERTWGPALAAGNQTRPKEEFWARAISAVKAKWPSFIFIAEAYWDREWTLQQLGFDYTYDKRLYDRLRGSKATEILAHSKADPSFQSKLVRFIENHDEQRAVIAFGPMKSRAAAILASTLPGMHLFHDGQFDGRAVHLPVQLGREPAEAPRGDMREFYERLLAIVQSPVFKKGQWTLESVEPAGNDSHANFIAYTWSLDNERRLVVVNYADQPSRGHVRFDARDLPETVLLTDQLDNRRYEYARSNLQTYGLFIELPPFGAHIFSFKRSSCAASQ
jgi:hypothetical protein